MNDPTELAERFASQLRSLVMLLRRTASSSELTPQQYTVLGSLLGGARRMSDLADEQGVRLPTMTVQINRMENAGMVRRGRDTADARVVTVHITQLGRRLYGENREERIRVLTERLGRLSPDERGVVEQFMPILNKLLAEA